MRGRTIQPRERGTLFPCPSRRKSLLHIHHCCNLILSLHCGRSYCDHLSVSIFILSIAASPFSPPSAFFAPSVAFSSSFFSGCGFTTKACFVVLLHTYSTSFSGSKTPLNVTYELFRFASTFHCQSAQVDGDFRASTTDTIVTNGNSGSREREREKKKREKEKVKERV